MALINIKIFGIKVNDTLSFKIIVGGTCIILLLIFLGPSQFYDWTITSLITYVATVLIILGVTEFFINGDLGTRETLMIAAGSVLLLVSCAKTYNSLTETGIAIIKAFVWATIFSIFIEAGKKHAGRVEQKVRRFVEPKVYDQRREMIIDEKSGRVTREKWDGKITVATRPIEYIKEEKITRKPYLK